MSKKENTPVFKQAVSEMWRDRILQGAARVFAAKGFHKATTKQIAESAGIAEGTIYNYFKNKRSLLLALLEKVAAQPIKKILQDNPPDEPRQFFKLIIKDRYHFLQTHGELLAPIMAEVFIDPTLREELHRKVIKPVADLLEKYLQTRIESGNFRSISPMILSYGIPGAVMFNSILKLTDIDPRFSAISEDELSDGLIDWFMAGLSANK